MLSNDIYGDGLEKTALNARPLWEGVKGVFDHGLWQHLADSHVAGGLGKGGVGNAVGRTAKFLTGKPGQALAAYGWAGMIPGVNLPGSDLAFNISQPILGTAFAAPNVISSMRAGSEKGKKAIKADAEAGSQAAIGDFLTGLNANPGMVQQPNGYRQFMEGSGIDFKGADAYRKNQNGGDMGTWNKLQSIFGDSNEIIGHQARQQIQQQFNKTASIGEAAMNIGGKLMSGVGHAFKWGTPPLAAYGIYDAATRDKPHDEQAIQQEGYAATQAAIQKKMESLSGMERFALKMDPTLAAQKLEEIMPGSLAKWESRTGQKYQPGWIASTMNAWKTGGTPSYYTYDAGGSRHYI